jgi:hypothetical protein
LKQFLQHLTPPVQRLSQQRPAAQIKQVIQNLTGGAGADTFVFADGAGVDGTIDGGGGTNTLDYSAYSSSVLVDLQTGFATGVGAGIANIQNVTGGAGGGSGVYNILVGNGGNFLRGGDDRRNLLIAGASASLIALPWVSVCDLALLHPRGQKHREAYVPDVREFDLPLDEAANSSSSRARSN